ncbi:unnamed protein product [Linum trigynum]
MKKSNQFKTHRLSPISLLHRFREAVFRLIMISALSKPTRPRTASPSPDHTARRATYHHRHLADPYNSEALADCIEFIKKTSVTVHGDTSAAAAIASSNTTVMPVPVM